MLPQECIQAAVIYRSRVVQNDHYLKEIKCRKTECTLPQNSKIAGLDPLLNSDGVLYVGGRLGKIDWPDA